MSALNQTLLQQSSTLRTVVVNTVVVVILFVVHPLDVTWDVQRIQ